MGGGSLPALPRVEAPGFLQAAVSMSPMDLPGEMHDQWALGNGRGDRIMYSSSAKQLTADVKPKAGKGTAYWIDPKTGSVLQKKTYGPGMRNEELRYPSTDPVVIWVTHAQ